MVQTVDGDASDGSGQARAEGQITVVPETHAREAVHDQLK
jgi:predicted RNA-binding protein with TRAM domain